MSFHNKGLLGEGSSPGTPLTLDEEEGTKKKLRTLTSDPLSRDLGDPEFMEFKTKQFDRAYPGKQELDASGRAIDSPPVVKDIEPFKPKVKRRDLDFGAPGHVIIRGVAAELDGLSHYFPLDLFPEFL